MSTASIEQQPISEIVGEVVELYSNDRTGDLLSILEMLQERHPNDYLPIETLEEVSRQTGVALSQVYSVATFYSFFNLKPQGDHTVTVCRGTACHTRGSRDLLNQLKTLSGVGAQDDEEGEGSFTTEDKKLTVRTVACFGQCALAPVVSSDEDIHSNVTSLMLDEIYNNLKSSS